MPVFMIAQQQQPTNTNSNTPHTDTAAVQDASEKYDRARVASPPASAFARRSLSEEDWMRKEKTGPTPPTASQSVGGADACFFGSLDFVGGSARGSEGQFRTSSIHVVKWASVELHAERVDVHNREPDTPALLHLTSASTSRLRATAVTPTRRYTEPPRRSPSPALALRAFERLGAGERRKDEEWYAFLSFLSVSGYPPISIFGAKLGTSLLALWEYAVPPSSAQTKHDGILHRPRYALPPPYGHGARQEQGQDDLSAGMRGRVRRITGSVLILPLVRDGTIAYPVLGAALVRPPPHPTDHPPRIGPALTARSPSIRDAEKEGRERQPRGRRRAGGAQLRDRDGARYEHGVVQHAGLTAGGSASGMRGWARQADSARNTKHVATEADVREDEVRPTVSSLSQA
ncbi:hypothetical protein B0H14DRAFT_2600575 [Mycena olivaceomarginata]|nr:hypothetical protein B0H14DRAFT_2600575 [Mycena olivaceomarginata]